MTADPLSIATGGLFSNLAGVTQGLLKSELHPRTEIRRYVAEHIRFESDAEDRVFTSRLIPLDGEQLAQVGPVILVYTKDDPVAPEKVSDGPPIYRNHLQVLVEIVGSSALLDLQDALDAIALAVEVIVTWDETQGGHAAGTEYLGSTFEEDGEGEYPFAALTLTFRVEYHWSAADLIGDDLEKIHTDWDVAAPDGQVEAQDDIDFTKE